ncbi:MAG TPA: hypothetical protein VFV23_10730 [Verrucomicrobiae bacterium]|nr:hypothetical protein [Verrucomicrobiae bacterium]
MRTLNIHSFAATPALLHAADQFLTGIGSHKNFIASCSPGLQNVLWPYVNERQDLSERWNHPNLIIPFLFNELFNLQDAEKLKTICAAYLACDHFTHLLDDLADEKQREDQALLAHASHLMLSRGRKLYVDITSDPSGFLDFFEKYLTDAMSGEQGLWKRVKNLKPYDEADFNMLRSRGSMLNICLAAYCDIADRWNMWSLLEYAFGEIIVGIQLLDDVVDVEKDFKNSIYTQPLVTAISKLGNSEPAWENISEQLIHSNGWTDSIAVAVSFIERGKAELAKVSLPSICSALDNIILSADELSKAIISARKASTLSASVKVNSILKLPIIRNLSH